MNLAAAREIFLASAAMSFEQRWSSVRNVTTSIEQMEHVARLAGWNVVRWFPGDAPEIRLDDGEVHALGQSILVLDRPTG
jgi:hypothetical protein